MENIKFARNLVKGKIAETIFAQMLRESENFTVLEFGYEKVMPELFQQGLDQKSPTAEIIRSAPDFAIIDHSSHEVQLVEVKYKRILDKEYVLKNAQHMALSWNPSYLFIASTDGFYFDSVKNVIAEKGAIKRFVNTHVPKATQDKYLQILNDFEGVNKK